MEVSIVPQQVDRNGVRQCKSWKCRIIEHLANQTSISELVTRCNWLKVTLFPKWDQTNLVSGDAVTQVFRHGLPLQHTYMQGEVDNGG